MRNSYWKLRIAYLSKNIYQGSVEWFGTLGFSNLHPCHYCNQLCLHISGMSFLHYDEWNIRCHPALRRKCSRNSTLSGSIFQLSCWRGKIWQSHRQLLYPLDLWSTQDLWIQLNNLEFYLQAKVQRKVWKSPQEVKLGASEGCIEANQNHSAVTKTATKLRLTRTDFTSPHIKTVIRSVFCIENCLDICF